MKYRNASFSHQESIQQGEQFIKVVPTSSGVNNAEKNARLLTQAQSQVP